MSGHSKWHNIQGRKNAQDAKRGKIFQKISRELFMAAKQGGSDPNNNPSLRLVMDKARAANMPKDNVKRALDKADGGDATRYDEVTYEGYGPAGIAILVEALTDNKNRTSSDVRVAITRHGGTMATAGAVSYMFDRRGYFVIDREGLDVDEDQMLEAVLEAGAEDLQTSDDEFEIYTDPKDFTEVRDSLEEQGFHFTTSELTMVPQNTVPIPEEKLETFQNLIDALEDNDDVQNVYTSAQWPDDAE
ncbi:MAG: YebC/PmpR family DNA-binding transcriptional regulator [Lactobacillus sp.]|jgi:YebC/PmpR family DNA-binding regulatory protein|uniref:Probable transcriptional regulatory protein ACFQ41_09985 n=1 Tax=Lacticaseibacillus suilingensis TaxID=2799577 RepID=A0ABW4BGL0_9LACO|nr:MULTISPECIES: YebC/PmpR family DNA-binding transcriptional regulator [Lacticaseibacillus]MCI1894139.1 YebC/PmpR family DNA-binding transcriptional regulator [Lactobacillus sp.]MCI1917972.1 YebC/PmpR family DNA-binding transcriptional regulator [Lactobacillus sp.]MCI1941455.1 YebC/PmpR family DNA-binding transcriptional regulator [Lactobacillus sp.]MCI1972034.1 YebC/PmpR family DNA-binding transcriptional regulator [Lactobacillus sp.]MCI2016123.1 YebC/PmpR family DNA-binding transcriptional 